MATDIAEMLNLKMLDSPPPIFASFAVKACQEKRPKDVLRATALILEALPFLTAKNATLAFERLTEHARQTSVESHFDFLLRAAHKLLKNSTIDAKIVGKFIDLMCHCRLVGFANRPPFFSLAATKLLCTAIRKVPTLVEPVCKLYAEWYPKLQSAWFPLFLAPFSAVLKVKDVSRSVIDPFPVMAFEILKKLKEPDWIAALACFRLLTKCWEVTPGCLKRAAKCIKYSTRWLDMANLKYQEDVNMNCFLDILPVIIRFIFTLYGVGPNGTVEINKAVLKRVFDFLPFPADVKCNNVLIKHLLVMLGHNEFDFLRNRGCAVFVEILALEPEDLGEFNFEAETVTGMKVRLRKTLGSHPERIKKVVGKLTNASRDRPTLEQILAGGADPRPAAAGPKRSDSAPTVRKSLH
jgi:hypothetical protein